MFFWLSSPFPLTLLFPLYHYLTKAHGFLTASYRTVGPGAAAWSLPAAAEGIAAFHRALLPIPGGTRRWRRLPGATACWIHGCTLLPGLHSAMSSRRLGSPSSQRRSESSAEIRSIMMAMAPDWTSGSAGLYRTFIVGFGGPSRRTCQERQNRCFLPSSTVLTRAQQMVGINLL